mgnify:CR=1 FL=1
MKHTAPHFSIITVVRNAAETIESCLASVRSQTVDLEHIVVDGCSTDGTLERLQRHAATGTIDLSSGRDNGIYDAMNKGLRRARGDIVGILNADDFYAHPHILARIDAAFATPEIDAVYSDLVYANGDDTSNVVRYWRSGPYSPRAFLSGWMPPHPTFFVRRSVYERCGMFRTDLGSAADYELMLRFLFKHRIAAAYVPEVAVVMRTGGVSNQSWKHRMKANRMDRRAWAVNGLRPRPWTLTLKPVRKLGQYVASLRPGIDLQPPATN